MAQFFLYCRKSSEAEDRQILSIDSQSNELRQYAARKGLHIAAILTETKSAKAPGRPVFNSLMERVYRGEADGILCWKLDRLARNPVDGGSIIWAIKEYGVKIVTPFQTFGESEDNVVLMYLEFGMAQKYVDDLSKTVKRGLRAKAESGWFPGSAPPGYVNQINSEGRNVVGKDPKRFPLIRKCWDLMLTGNHTPAEIRMIANTAWGYKTARGNPLGRNTIYGIFSNSFYHGIYEFPRRSGTWHTGRHTPMVTEEEFDAVRQLLAISRKMPRNRKVFAFTDLIRCGNCASAVTAEEKHQLICSQCRFKFAYRSKETCPRCKTPIAGMENPIHLAYTYYHCTKSGNPTCNEGSIRIEKLETQLCRILEKIRLPIQHELWLNRCFGRLYRSRADQDALSAVRNLYPGATSEIQRRIVTAILSNLRLQDRQLTAVLKPPFVFLAENEMPSLLDQNPF